MYLLSHAASNHVAVPDSPPSLLLLSAGSGNGARHSERRSSLSGCLLRLNDVLWLPARKRFYQQANSSDWNFSLHSCRERRQGGGRADVISRGVQVHRQPCHMLLGGSVMRTEMHGSCTGHRGSRLASQPAGRCGHAFRLFLDVWVFSSL